MSSTVKEEKRTKVAVWVELGNVVKINIMTTILLMMCHMLALTIFLCSDAFTS